MDTQAGALVGVEEEFLVADAATGVLTPRAGEVVEAATATLGHQVCAELTRYQLEVKTAPCGTLSELREELVWLRRTAAAAARGLGLALVSSGSPVLGPPGPPPITEGARYELGTSTFRSLHDESHVCAIHVHVHCGEMGLAVMAGNHVRPWLPALTAALANSPFWLGRDTGYASWRALTWGRWPVAGPPPYFRSQADFEALAVTLSGTGALVDPGTIFWDIRPSAHLPTLEFRACDVPQSVSESVLLAGVLRALVSVAATRVMAGDPGPETDAAVLRAACWRAARDGLSGLCPDADELVPVPDLLARLVDEVSDELERHGELSTVKDGIAALVASGCGADRQRAVYARTGSLAEVVSYLAV
jgi:carboxylate-amine ligase